MNEVQPGAVQNPGLTPLMLNHAAYVTHDVERTTDFYTRVMGMALASSVMDDRLPSTGKDLPYFHIFFRMRDGSTIAFFEAPGIPLPAASSHPAYDTFNHIALQAESPEEVHRWHAWLVENDVKVTGPVDHNGLILSIYFHDPNGVRLEITYPTDPQWNRHTERARADLQRWTEAKQRAAREGRDVAEALVELCKAAREERGD